MRIVCIGCPEKNIITFFLFKTTGFVYSILRNIIVIVWDRKNIRCPKSELFEEDKIFCTSFSEHPLLSRDQCNLPDDTVLMCSLINVHA